MLCEFHRRQDCATVTFNLVVHVSAISYKLSQQHQFKKRSSFIWRHDGLLMEITNLKLSRQIKLSCHDTVFSGKERRHDSVGSEKFCLINLWKEYSVDWWRFNELLWIWILLKDLRHSICWRTQSNPSTVREICKIFLLYLLCDTFVSCSVTRANREPTSRANLESTTSKVNFFILSQEKISEYQNKI